jgi:predicted dehydrogenase
MEAFMYRFHPQWVRAHELVRDGALGGLRAVETFFSYSNDDPRNIRNRTETGGGALLDIGCYAISLSRFLYGYEPARVVGRMERDPRFGTDRLTSAILDFGSGTSTFTCATQLEPHQRVQIFGERGRIEIEIPFNAPADRRTRIWLQRGTSVEELGFDSCNQYVRQGESFAHAILRDTPGPTPLDDAVANMTVIDAVTESASSRQWVAVRQ